MKNQLKTFILLALLTAVLLFAGRALAGPTGLAIAGVFVVLMNVFSYFFSHKLVLAMYKAKEATEKEQPELFKLVREVAHLANIPMPKVYVIPTMSPNAFATGRDPKHAVVACTQGIMQLLSKDELKGVIAHEVSHIKNRDILIQTVAATIAGVISYLAIMARWGAIFGGLGGRSRDGGNLISLLVLSIITPLIAMLIQLAISRSREYLADESAAKILHSSHGLASALEKLDSGIKQNPMKMGSPSTSSLFIANPFKGSGMMKLLSTHPPMKERISRLKGMNV
ncbi:zinc metalloprotease HtpX [Candidatus Woesearchaeota archaeon]|nr:zinc metalloprotease HtpX [Candidatus Woesearchaeota archaeon]MBT5271860.1 zinc metalloprotease HtpX [Candidatus Woesearchaeota archaeon]MBT6041676.1 zinc metalloprotease HtpX [Candidatus Woesearchaeota archaeon]MBT6337348.1 zinc metalloprotease HtpX [Candidatus Woesearchaeota archaeon]MBT7927596.1 zinc metalloprotease HtpX [Candidatus Woesearchaeota archaeon]